MVLVFFTLPSQNVPIFAANLLFLGLFALPVTPVCFAYSVELTFPAPESMSNGMMILPSKITGSLFSLIGGYLASFDPLYAAGLYSFNLLISFIISLYIKEELRRLRAKDYLIKDNDH